MTKTKFYFCFREQDGSWSEWMQCSRETYLRRKDDPFYQVLVIYG